MLTAEFEYDVHFTSLLVDFRSPSQTLASSLKRVILSDFDLTSVRTSMTQDHKCGYNCASLITRRRSSLMRSSSSIRSEVTFSNNY